MLSVIFDMDGTLLDTQRICIEAWNYAGALQGFENTGSSIKNVCGMNETGWTNYLIENFKGLDADAFKAEAFKYIEKNGKIEFKKGAPELLAFLKEYNVKLAIASGSSRSTVISHLTEVNAVQLFDVIVGGDEVVNGKPQPDIFLLAAERLGVNPEECFVFEDSSNGIKAGYRAGMKCIGIPDIAPFDEEAKSIMLKELPSFLEGIELIKKYI